MRRFASVALLLAAAVPVHAQNRSGSPTAVVRAGPEVGQRAPDFTLPWASKDGVGPVETPYQLWGDLGKTVVLVFYSRAFTRSCTAMMRNLTEQHSSLFGPDVVVIGISTDPSETQSRFAAQLGVPFRLLSDAGQKVAKKYGNHDSSGFIRRSIYIIGRNGNVNYRNMRFDPFDPKAYTELGLAVRSANASK